MTSKLALEAVVASVRLELIAGKLHWGLAVVIRGVEIGPKKWPKLVWNFDPWMIQILTLMIKLIF